MKIFNILLFSLVGMNFVQAQATKVAILDFENTSGKPEYDALAKAISSMLITDLANNIHPKKVEFFERSQLNKLLDEQKLQKSKNFDAKTAVDFGKLSGVNYVFVGSVFVLDGTCNFSSKLVDVQTSKILLAKEVSGTIVNFLQLKSQLAEAIAIQLNNPITLDPSYKDQSTTLSTINQYGKILTTMDQGDADKAEQMRSLFEETNPDFKYFKDLTEDIVKIKIEIKEIKETLDDVLEPEKIALELIAQNKELDKAIKYLDLFNAKNNYASAYGDTKKLFTYHQKARIYYRLGDFKKSILYYDSTLYLDKNYLTAYLAKMTLMMGGEFAKRLDNNITTVLKPDRDYSKEIEVCFVQFTSYGKKNISSFNPKIYRDGGKVCENNPMSQDCRFFRHQISIPGCFNDVWLEDFSNHILRPSNLYSEYLISINQSKKALLILENCLFQQFEFFKDTYSWAAFNPDSLWIHWAIKDRTFNLLAPQEKKDYNSIVDGFNPIFEMQGSQLIGDSDNSGFTDNIVLLSNLLVFEKRYNDAINLLVGFRTIFNTNTDKYTDYGIEKFKVLVNIFLLSKLAGKENLNIHAECEQIYEKEKDKIQYVYDKENLTFEQFLGEEYKSLQNFYTNADIKNGLILVFENKLKQSKIDYAQQLKYFTPPIESKEDLKNDDGNFYYSNLFFEEVIKDIGVSYDRAKFIAIKTYALDNPEKYSWDQTPSKRFFYLLIDKERFFDKLNLLDTLTKGSKMSFVFTARHQKVSNYKDGKSWDEHFLIGEVSWLDFNWKEFSQSSFSNKNIYTVSTNGQIKRITNELGQYCVYMYSTASNENTDVFILDYYKGMRDEYLHIGTLKLLFNNPTYSPQCNEDGTLTISLPIGSYKVLVRNSKNQWNSDVIITLGQCKKYGIK
jgi:TolB-like protein